MTSECLQRTVKAVASLWKPQRRSNVGNKPVSFRSLFENSFELFAQKVLHLRFFLNICNDDQNRNLCHKTDFHFNKIFC